MYDPISAPSIPIPPPPSSRQLERVTIGVNYLHGNRYEAVVIFMDRKFRAGKWPTESAAWEVAQRLAAELRADADNIA